MKMWDVVFVCRSVIYTYYYRTRCDLNQWNEVQTLAYGAVEFTPREQCRSWGGKMVERKLSATVKLASKDTMIRSTSCDHAYM
jgi:hypothetical protein